MTADHLPTSSPGGRDIAAERRRQIAAGHTAADDARHSVVDLIDAGLALGEYATCRFGMPTPPTRWPSGWTWTRPDSRRAALVQAGAMMAAAIDRLDAWEVERQGVPHREPGLDRTAHLSRNALAISRWVDAGLPTDDPAARLWARTAKVAEEAGEVIAAVTDFVGANPRRTGDQDAVIRELCDVAFAALGAIAHLHDNDVDAVAVLADHAARVVARAGIRVSSDQGGPGASGS